MKGKGKGKEKGKGKAAAALALALEAKGKGKTKGKGKAKSAGSEQVPELRKLTKSEDWEVSDEEEEPPAPGSGEIQPALEDEQPKTGKKKRKADAYAVASGSKAEKAEPPHEGSKKKKKQTQEAGDVDTEKKRKGDAAGGGPKKKDTKTKEPEEKQDEDPKDEKPEEETRPKKPKKARGENFMDRNNTCKLTQHGYTSDLWLSTRASSLDRFEIPTDRPRSLWLLRFQTMVPWFGWGPKLLWMASRTRTMWPPLGEALWKLPLLKNLLCFLIHIYIFLLVFALDCPRKVHRNNGTLFGNN